VSNMTRAIKEWIGRTPDSMPPPTVRLRILERYNGTCQLSGIKIQVGDEWHLDHKTPIWDGGPNREINLWPVLGKPHRDKTREEAAQRAEGKRHRMKQAGIKSKPRSSFQTNRDGPLKKKLNGEVVRR